MRVSNQLAILIMTREEAIEKYQRDSSGLLKTVDYEFLESGAIDWRKMVSNEFLYPNKESFEKWGKEVPTSIEGLNDNQLLIKLGGIRELAKIRGYDNVNFEVVKTEEDECTIKCSIDFTPNYENPNGVHYSEVANATVNNVSGFGSKFLECFAANRAFVRCVRGFLNINIVGADEIDTSEKGEEKEKKVATSKSLTPQGSLESRAHKLGFQDYESFKTVLKEFWTDKTYKNEGVKEWSDFGDIPAKEARILISLLEKRKIE